MELKFRAKFIYLFFMPALLIHADAGSELREQYDVACQCSSDINEHVPTLYRLAKDCGTVVEIGMRSMVSSWGILQGLSENSSSLRSYFGIDIVSPSIEILNRAKRLAEDNGVKFNFLQANDLEIDIEPTEMLFIDSLHTYCHLTYELEKFSPRVSKYIAMHDTSWGNIDDCTYKGDFSEYPSHYDRTKRGLWLAIEDFLQNHDDWMVSERYFNNYGFVVLKRRNI